MKDVELTEHNSFIGRHYTQWMYVNERYRKIAIPDTSTKANVFMIISLDHDFRKSCSPWEGVITDDAVMKSPDWTRVRSGDYSKSKEGIDYEKYRETEDKIKKAIHK